MVEQVRSFRLTVGPARASARHRLALSAQHAELAGHELSVLRLRWLLLGHVHTSARHRLVRLHVRRRLEWRLVRRLVRRLLVCHVLQLQRRLAIVLLLVARAAGRRVEAGVHRLSGSLLHRRSASCRSGSGGRGRVQLLRLHEMLLQEMGGSHRLLMQPEVGRSRLSAAGLANGQLWLLLRLALHA